MTDHGHHRARKSIALIGYRGSGKTVVGRELASLTGLPLVDTDELVTRRAGASIAEIFDRQGEAEFRRLECAAVAQAVAGPPSVISVGGGAVLDDGNVVALKSAATVVWLTAPTDDLITRIRGDQSSPQTRPPLTNQPLKDEVERLLAERTPFYREAADHVLDTAGHSPAAVAQLVRQQLDLNVD
ncbi:MAG: shikimate kinase [Planctomycetes bacterium]|nr:shikimate kinase [Planctomycetota bacterium]